MREQELDPRWDEMGDRWWRVHGVSVPLAPGSLHGDQIALCRAEQDGTTAGEWVLWTRYGPLVVYRYHSSPARWRVSAYRIGATGLDPLESALFVPLEEWMIRAELRRVSTPTRRELLQIIRQALRDY